MDYICNLNNSMVWNILFVIDVCHYLLLLHVLLLWFSTPRTNGQVISPPELFLYEMPIFYSLIQKKTIKICVVVEIVLDKYTHLLINEITHISIHRKSIYCDCICLRYLLKLT